LKEILSKFRGKCVTSKFIVIDTNIIIDLSKEQITLGALKIIRFFDIDLKNLYT
jgi:hypothetical protein